MGSLEFLKTLRAEDGSLVANIDNKIVNVKKFIWVTFQKVGYHKYPNAPTEPFDVSYLRDTHRHLFKFRVGISVEHSDRDIEFHQFLNWIESLYSDSQLKLDYKSCEMISDDLYSAIHNKYPNREVTVEISEDGECGSLTTYKPLGN